MIKEISVIKAVMSWFTSRDPEIFILTSDLKTIYAMIARKRDIDEKTTYDLIVILEKKLI